MLSVCLYYIVLIVGLLKNDNGDFSQVGPFSFSSSNQDFFLFGFVFLEFVSRTVAVGDRPLSGLFHQTAPEVPHNCCASPFS